LLPSIQQPARQIAALNPNLSGGALNGHFKNPATPQPLRRSDFQNTRSVQHPMKGPERERTKKAAASTPGGDPLRTDKQVGKGNTGGNSESFKKIIPASANFSAGWILPLLVRAKERKWTLSGQCTFLQQASSASPPWRRCPAICAMSSTMDIS
jgi:hypothetical protein